MNNVGDQVVDQPWQRRVVVKLREAPPRADAEAAFDRRLEAERPEIVVAAREVVDDARIEPYLQEELELSPGRRGTLDAYVAVPVDDEAAAEKLAASLNARDDVEIAYVEAGPVPPPVNAADDPRSMNQGYLDAAPGGIDARWAWDFTNGHDIGFVDLEQGWTLNHEDLAAAGITLISGLNQAFAAHGTAVLGEVVAVDNTIGDVGIAPRATARVVSQWRTATTYGTAAAILSAVDHMASGDVLLLEAQTNSNGRSLVPVEVEQAVFDAISAATSAGIIVVEAAGNGGNDLDTFTDAAGNRILRRGDAGFRDSGAIMVGAASSTAPHDRLGFSNFGSRIDCFAWGQDIDTTGGSGAGTSDYTAGFNGTSGASPIIVGAALLLQRWWRDRYGYRLGPWGMRGILASTANTPSRTPATDRIGMMPDLRGIIERQVESDRFTLHERQYEQWVYILFGILNDAPGVIWVPGKGPVPVDPGWGRRSRRDLQRFAALLRSQFEEAGVAVEMSDEQLAEASVAALAQTVGAKEVAPVG